MNNSLKIYLQINTDNKIYIKKNQAKTLHAWFLVFSLMSKFRMLESNKILLFEASERMSEISLAYSICLSVM